MAGCWPSGGLASNVVVATERFAGDRARARKLRNFTLRTARNRLSKRFARGGERGGGGAGAAVLGSFAKAGGTGACRTAQNSRRGIPPGWGPGPSWEGRCHREPRVVAGVPRLGSGLRRGWGEGVRANRETPAFAGVTVVLRTLLCPSPVKARSRVWRVELGASGPPLSRGGVGHYPPPQGGGVTEGDGGGGHGTDVAVARPLRQATPATSPWRGRIVAAIGFGALRSRL